MGEFKCGSRVVVVKGRSNFVGQKGQVVELRGNLVGLEMDAPQSDSIGTKAQPFYTHVGAIKNDE